MHSPAQAIVWEICARNRRTLLVAFGLIPFCALCEWFTPPGHESIAVLQTFSILVTIVSLVWVCSFTANDSRGRFSGYPSWMYTLPLRTWRLVVWPAVLGAAMMIFAVSLWEVTVCRYWGIRIEARNVAWHVLATTGGLISVQALVWSLHRFRWIRIVALVAAIYSFLYVGLVAQLWQFTIGVQHWFAGGAAAILLAFGAAVAGVERDRRGEWVGWTGKLLESLMDLLPRRRGHFHSAAGAQFWFEWRRKGFLLAFFFGGPLTLALLLIPLPEALYLDPVETLMAFSGPFLLVLFIAGAIGGAMGKSDAWSSELLVHPIVATRPLTTAAMVFAKWKSAALVTALGWLLFCALSVPAIIWCNHADWPNEGARQFWPEFATAFPRFWKWITNPIVILAMLATTWHAMIQAMSVTLAGSKRRIVFETWRGAITLALIIAVGIWAIRQPSASKVLLLLQWLPLLTLGLTVLKMVLAFRAFHALRKLSSPQEFLGAAAVWICVTTLVVSAAFLARADAGVASTLLWFIVAVQYLPAGEIPGGVVALAQNRHR
jgi:hypothetical protein